MLVRLSDIFDMTGTKKCSAKSIVLVLFHLSFQKLNLTFKPTFVYLLY